MEYRILALGDVASETGLALLEKKLRPFKKEHHVSFTVVNGENISGTGLTPAQALELTVESFRFMAAFEGAVPGASEVECGNYRDMDLPAAKAEAAAMLPVLEGLTAEDLHY